MSSIIRLRSIGAQRVLSSNAFPSSVHRSIHSSVIRATTPTTATATAAPSTPPPPPPKPIPANHFRISIDGRELDVPNNITAIQACEIAGVYIPRFCYHERLSVAGNCRMCLVEVEKVPKPVASCAYPLMPGMKIKTNTPMVKKAREGVMEMLLANHPLDCPICDQGGECDLQDQSLHYGSDKSRFREVKRTVEDKEFGPVVKTVMTRCIHCTRCVRLTTEVCGITDLGTTGRGNTVEIGTYVSKKIDSELSGNVVDVCPVGALTSKPYAFKARPWDLKHTFSVDVLDATGPAIRIDTRGPEVMRVLPCLNEEINEEWISDKTRLSYDGLKRQRLDTPLLKKGDQYVPVTWMEALSTIAAKVRGYTPNDLLAIAGDLADSEAMIALKDLFNRLGSDNTLHSQSSARLPADLRSNYIFNSTILGLEDADFVLLVGSNPRMESPLIAARLRKIVRNNNVTVASIGPEALLNLTHTHLGNNASILKDIAAGKHPLSDKLKAAKKPVVIVGMGALQRSDAFSLLATVHSLKNIAPNLVQEGKWNGINILHTQSSRVGALDIGFVPGPSAPASKAKFVYLLNADDFDTTNIASDAFIVYQGHHGDKGATIASIVLPAAAYTEKSATYVNIEGRPQKTNAATAKLASAREDWQIIRALSEVIGAPLPYQTIEQVRARLAEVAPHLQNTNKVDAPILIDATSLSSAALQSTPFDHYINNFYFTNVISRNSRVMSKCSVELPTSRNSYKHAQTQIGAKTQNSMV